MVALRSAPLNYRECNDCLAFHAYSEVASCQKALYYFNVRSSNTAIGYQETVN